MKRNLRSGRTPRLAQQPCPPVSPFQMTEVAASKNPFAEILRRIAELRPSPVVSTGQKAASVTLSTLPGDVRHDGAGLGGVPHATAVPDFRERVTAL